MLRRRRSSCNSMLPVPVEVLQKITSSILEGPVSISAVAMIVSEPPILHSYGQHRRIVVFGSACVSVPHHRIILYRRQEQRIVVHGRRRVDGIQQDDHIVPHSTSLFAFCNAMVETFSWFSAGSSKVEAIPSLHTAFHIGTSSGRSSTSTTIR